jgi:hypothetical protein
MVFSIVHALAIEQFRRSANCNYGIRCQGRLKTHPPAPVENAPAPDRGARLRS